MVSRLVVIPIRASLLSRLTRLARRWGSFPLFAHNWAIKRAVRLKVEDALAAYAHGRLIDIGCGEKPYARFLRGRVTEHFGIDLADGPLGTAALDRIGTAYETHEPDASADTVLHTQVLEHLEEPADAVQESMRILRPGGHLVLSTDFAWHLHAPPRDFFRYSPYGLRYLFEQAGFQVLTVKPVTGAWFLIFQEAAYAVRRVARRNVILLLLALPLTHLLQLLAVASDRLLFDDQIGTGWLIVGRKPEGRDQLVGAPAARIAGSRTPRDTH